MRPLAAAYQVLDYWVLSSPSGSHPQGSINLGIGWTEAFRLNIDQSGHLSGWVQVNGVELFGDGMSDKSIVRFLRQHPGVIIDEAPYQTSGPFNYNVIAETWTCWMKSLTMLKNTSRSNRRTTPHAKIESTGHAVEATLA